MKQLLVTLLSLITWSSSFSQQPSPNDFKGNWKASGNRGHSINLNFLDTSKIILSPGDPGSTKGEYTYRMTYSKNDIILSLGSDDKKPRDSLVIIMARLTPEEYQLKSFMHYYEDGRPPEMELYENDIYILKRVKNN